MVSKLASASIFKKTRRQELEKVLNEKLSLSKVKKYFEVDFESEIIEPTPVIRFNTIPIGCLGDFTLITGKPKTRKTFLIGLIVSSLYSETGGDIITGSLPPYQDRIAYFDTEQSEFELRRASLRIKSLIGNCIPDELKIYNLRELAHNVKRKFIEDVVEADEKIGLVVIDGIRDLITDINDPKQATSISEWLLYLTSTYNVHIITVLHQNKADGNARGHIGTELNNKASSVISVSVDNKDKSTSIVSAEYMRGKDFESFGFRINENGLPYTTNDRIEGPVTRKAISPTNYPIDTHKEVLSRAFKHVTSMKYASLWQSVKDDFGSHGINFGINTAKEFVKYQQENNLINNDKGNWKLS